MAIYTRILPKNPTSALAALFLLGGCGGGEGFAQEDIDSINAAIDHGDLVASNNAPYNSVVRLLIGDAGEDGGLCSALKIGTNRFLTAAHCLKRDNCTYVGNNSVIDVHNGLQTIGVGTNVTVSASYIHPSYRFDFDSCDSENSGPHAYDVAIFDTTTSTSGIPTANAFWPNHVPDDTALMQVGYGKDFYDVSHAFQKQSARYRAASRTSLGATAARYAHQILTSETGAFRQAPDGGDSGGALFYEASAGTWRVAGVTQNSNADDADPATGGFARIANVGRWINAPHNGSTSSSGTGFFQSVTFRQCMLVTSSVGGTRARLGECEGYDPNLHGHLWEVSASGSYYLIRTRKSGAARCLTVPTNTTNVTVADCNSAQNQQWTIATFPGNSAFRTVRNRATNLYLTDSAGTDANLSVSPNSEATFLFYR